MSEGINFIQKEFININYFIDMGKVNQKFIPMIIPIKYANIVGIPIGTPIILTETVVFDKKAIPIVFMKTYNNPNEKNNDNNVGGNSMKKLKIVTIGGGSSYTPELVEGFIKRHSELPVSELWLVDIEEGKEKLDIVGNLAKRMVKKSGIDMKIYTTLDRREALRDADFVTTQIRVGLLDARAKDEKIPLSHGVMGQETNGAGGLFKALRTVPVILDIIKDIKELCSDAWLINFANPAGIITEAVFRYTDFKKFIGLCNVPIGMRNSLAEALDIDRNRLTMDFAGLNHMVYGLNAYIDGKEAMSEAIEAFIKDSSSMKNIKNIPFEPDFIRALGVIPCPYHRYYYKRQVMLDDELESYKEGKSRAEVVQELEKDLFELYKDESLDIKPPQLEKRGGAYYSDAACNLISSIYNDKGDVQVVNTLNKGAMPDFDYDDTVEISSIITKEGPKPIAMGKLPVEIKGLITTIKSFEKLSAKAGATGDYDTAYKALVINPLIPSDKVAKTLLDEMIEAHKKYLPLFVK